MNPPDNNSIVRYLPLATGLLSAILLTVFTLQRSSMAQSAATVQAGLHMMAAIAALASLTGLVLFFVLPKSLRSSKIFLFGVILNFLTSVWGFVLIKAL